MADRLPPIAQTARASSERPQRPQISVTDTRSGRCSSYNTQGEVNGTSKSARPLSEDEKELERLKALLRAQSNRLRKRAAATAPPPPSLPAKTQTSAAASTVPPSPANPPTTSSTAAPARTDARAAPVSPSSKAPVLPLPEVAPADALSPFPPAQEKLVPPLSAGGFGYLNGAADLRLSPSSGAASEPQRDFLMSISTPLPTPRNHFTAQPPAVASAGDHHPRSGNFLTQGSLHSPSGSLRSDPRGSMMDSPFIEAVIPVNETVEGIDESSGNSVLTGGGGGGGERHTSASHEAMAETLSIATDTRMSAVAQVGTPMIELRKIMVEPIITKRSSNSATPSQSPVLLAAPEVEVQKKLRRPDSFAQNQARWRHGRKRGISIVDVTPPAQDDAMQSNFDGHTIFSQIHFLTRPSGEDDDGANRSIGPPRPSARSLRDVSMRDAEISMASLALGRMSMASCSMARVTDGALAIMEMLANEPDLLLPSPSETSVVRVGDVLSAKHILKLDLQDAMRDRHGTTGMIAGAPYFRMVPKLNIGGVAQADISAVRTIVNELQRAHAQGPIIWINLREEPLVYINNAAHIVRKRQEPLQPIIIPDVTGPGIEAVEAKLKQEVLQEAYENGGNISVHIEGREGLMEDKWECAGTHNVFTLVEVFQNIAQGMAETKGGMELQYYRRPITQNIGPRPQDFDFVFEACMEQPKAVFIFNCQTGRGRTSAMMQIASIVRFYQMCKKDVSVDIRVLRGSSSNTLAFRTIQKIVSLFPDGKLHERRLMILMDLADKVYSMADHISDAFASITSMPEVAMMRLQLYGLFLIFSYYCEQRLWNHSLDVTFSEFLERNPDVKVLITSVRQQLQDQLEAERVTAPENVSDEPEIARLVRRRKGNVLSSGRILCSIPMPKTTEVHALRQLGPDVPIFTCGRVAQRAREDLVREIRAAFPGHKRVHWLSLRAEPMVVINDINYTLSDYSAPLLESDRGATMHVSTDAIEQIEERLCRDVLLESQEYKGSIVLHRIDEDGTRKTIRVRVQTVRPPKSSMDIFAANADIVYRRVPIPFSGEMLATDVDPLLKYLSEIEIGPLDVFIINDTEGTTRSTVALNLVTMYRASRLAKLRELNTPERIIGLLAIGETGQRIPSAAAAEAATPVVDAPAEHIEILLASTICQMLRAGSLLPTVDAIITLGGKGRTRNVLHMVDFLKRRISASGLNKRKAVLDALHGLRCYLLVLLCAIYLDEMQDYSDSNSFTHWVREKTEVCFIVDNLDSRGETALKYISADNLMKADLSRRCGDVLTANFCMKADHFPGCQKKGLRPVVCGAPNLRKVRLVNVFGVAIPTLMGVHNILSLLGASTEPMQTYPGEENDKELFVGYPSPNIFDPDFSPEDLKAPLRGSVVWVNLREEPLLYVGDKPCVFRDLSAPYVNVELTGIQTRKIELVEDQLRADVLNEAARYDGRFLIHDEGTPGELVGAWETANPHTIKTLRQVYDELAAEGVRCLMVRQPVTDEQSPDMGDFDSLLQTVLPRLTTHRATTEPLSFIFNCQMGRGRTTTGMVICCLLIGLVIPAYYDELHAIYDPLYKETDTDLSRGEYTIITQLKRVLTRGRAAKYKLDLVLEACSDMQNLRTAIEALAIASQSPDTTEANRARSHHAGVHYLIRYFNLIVFTVYLEEEFDLTTKRMRRSFTEFMASHPELITLSSTATLK